MYFLLTGLRIFLMVLAGRICTKIMISYHWWSFPSLYISIHFFSLFFMHFLLIALQIFLMVLAGIICTKIKTFYHWWSFPSFYISMHFLLTVLQYFFWYLLGVFAQKSRYLIFDDHSFIPITRSAVTLWGKVRCLSLNWGLKGYAAKLLSSTFQLCCTRWF